MTKPVAAQLAPLQTTTPTIINVYALPAGFAVNVQPLVQAELQSPIVVLIEAEEPSWICEGVDEFLARANEEIQTMQPVGTISLDDIAPEQQRYFALKDQQRRLQRANERLAKMLQATKRPPKVLASSMQRSPSVRGLERYRKGGAVFRDQMNHLLAAQDINLELREMLSQPQSETSGIEAQLADVLREAAMLNFLLEDVSDDAPEQAVLYLRQLHPTRDRLWGLNDLPSPLLGAFQHHFGLETMPLSMPGAEASNTVSCILVRGRKALTLARYEHGTHLLSDDSGGFDLIQAHVVAVPEGETPASVLAALQTEQLPLAPVIRIYNENAWDRTTVADLCSGMLATKGISGHDLRTFMLSLLPLPEELH